MTSTPRALYRVNFTSRAERQLRRVGDAELSLIGSAEQLSDETLDLLALVALG